MASIGDLPAALFSPSKLVYLAHVILTGLKVLTPQPLWMFLLISAVFWAFEVGHNDRMRIILNGLGEKKKADIFRSR